MGDRIASLRSRLRQNLAPANRFETLLSVACHLLALAVLLDGLIAHARHLWVRLGEPAPVAILEPLFLRNALQSLQGGALYGPPSALHTSGMYTPGLDVVHGALLGLFGVHYPTLRVFAFLVFVGLAALFVRWIQRESHSIAWALLCGGLILALGADPTRQWFSNINLDAAYLATGFGGLYALCYSERSPWRLRIAAVALAASFLCKPQGIVLAAAGFVHVLLHDRRRALEFAAICASLAGAVSFYQLFVSDGWFWTTVVSVPMAAGPRTHGESIGGLMRTSPGLALAFAAAVPVLLLLAKGSPVARRARLLLIAGVATFAMSHASFMKEGGGRNSLFPVLLVGVLYLGIVPELVREAGRMTATALSASRLARVAIVTVLLYTGFEQSREISDRLVAAPSVEAVRAWEYAKYREFENQVDAAAARYRQPFVGARVLPLHTRGLPLNTSQIPVYDLLHRTQLATVQTVFGDAIARQRWDGMVLWIPPGSEVAREVRKHYRVVNDLGADPLIGWRVLVFEPRSRSAAQAGSHE